MNTFTPLSFSFICADKLLHMLIRFAFSNPFDWYIITIYKYSFSDNILSKYFWTIYFIVSKNHGKYAFFNKMSFFFRNETTQSSQNTWFIYNKWSYIECAPEIFPMFTFTFFDFFLQTVQYGRNSRINLDDFYPPKNISLTILSC
jgi:hypothetical protein